MKEKTNKIILTISVVSAITIIGLPISLICLAILTLDDIWH